MMPEKYEVAFVVYADIPEKDSSIGDLECNGTLKSYNCYSLRDARMYFTISAETPEEAYKKGIEKMQSGNADFGEAVVEDWYLEHVSYGDKYWYKEDLHFDCLACRRQICRLFFFAKKTDKKFFFLEN